jgi:hypothetical protein
MRKTSPAGLMVLLVGGSTSAWAAGPPCRGNLVLPDCSDAQGEVVWPANEPPTFHVTCTICDVGPGSPADGGPPMCWLVNRREDLDAVPLPWRSSIHWGFGVTIDGKTAGFGDADFEATNESCGGKWLQRYTAPLKPGSRYEIEYPGQDFPRTVVRFRVAGMPDAAPDVAMPAADAAPDVAVPAPDAAFADAGAALDASTDETASRGCSAGGGRASGADLLLLAFVLALGRAVALHRRSSWHR